MGHFLLLLLVSSPAYADESENEPEVIYKQRTEIDFEGLEIEGELIKPQGALLLDRRRAHFNPLIKLRRDFDDEMDKSVNEIK
tara:strand:- start:119 stop:367 length:249 start_codon:yes stop_codon:yes gene_type:complete